MNRTCETNKPPLKSPRLTAIFSQKIPIRFSHKSHHGVIHAQMEAPRASSSGITSPGFPPISLSLSLSLSFSLSRCFSGWFSRQKLRERIKIFSRPSLSKSCRARHRRSSSLGREQEKEWERERERGREYRFPRRGVRPWDSLKEQPDGESVKVVSLASWLKLVYA